MTHDLFGGGDLHSFAPTFETIPTNELLMKIEKLETCLGDVDHLIKQGLTSGDKAHDYLGVAKVNLEKAYDSGNKAHTSIEDAHNKVHEIEKKLEGAKNKLSMPSKELVNDNVNMGSRPAPSFGAVNSSSFGPSPSFGPLNSSSFGPAPMSSNPSMMNPSFAQPSLNLVGRR